MGHERVPWKYRVGLRGSPCVGILLVSYHSDCRDGIIAMLKLIGNESN